MNIVDGVLISVSSPPKDLVISGVRVIGEAALKGADIESVDIRGVVEIRNRAFMDCTSLREVKLPSSLRKIGEFAFSGTRMDTIELPYAVQLADDVFFDSWLTLVVSDTRIPLYKFPGGCKVVTPTQFRALERLGADRVYRDNPLMLKVRVPRRHKEHEMPRMGRREAMRRARKVPDVSKRVVPPRVPKKPVKRSKRPAPTKTPPAGPRGGECTICLKPSCVHLNMSRRLGAPLMW